MAAIITRGGKGSVINESENDDNLESLCGINEAKVGAYEVVAANQNSTIECSNASTTIITLGLILDILSAIDSPDFEVTIKNIGAGDVTVTPTTDTFDDGDAIKSLAQYEWMTIQSDSTQGKWNIISSSNASKVDGLDASQFLRSDDNDSATGDLILSGSNTHSGTTNTFSGTTVNLNPTNLQVGGVNMTSTAAELNRSDITTEGLVEASKVVTADSSANVNFPNGSAIGDANGNEVIIIGTTASADAQVIITNGVDEATLAATGDNADVDLSISAKGAGALTLNGYWHPELDGNGTQGRLLTSSSDTTNWTTITDSAMATAGATLAHIRVSNSVAANASATERVRTVYISNYVASFIGTAGVSGNMAPASNVRAYYYSVSHTGPTDTDYTDALVPVDSSGRFMWLVSTSFSPGGSASVTLEGYYT